MAGSPPDPLCCHYALAKDLGEKKMDTGVRARDKLVMDAIEAKQRDIFLKRDGLAETDKEKKKLRSVLSFVKSELENLQKSRNLHGFWRLWIFTKNSGIVGGIFSIEDTSFFFLVDKKKKKKQGGVTITLEEEGKGRMKNPKEKMPIFWNFRTQTQTTDSCFDFPLRCTACLGGAKEPRYFKNKCRCPEHSPLS